MTARRGSLSEGLALGAVSAGAGSPGFVGACAGAPAAVLVLNDATATRPIGPCLSLAASNLTSFWSSSRSDQELGLVLASSVNVAPSGFVSEISTDRA